MSRRLTDRERYAATTEEAGALAFFRGLALAYGGWFGHLGGEGLKEQAFAGWPDCTLLLPRPNGSVAAFAFEVKIADDRVSIAQATVLGLLHDLGWTAAVIRYGRIRPGEIDQDQAEALVRLRMGDA